MTTDLAWVDKPWGRYCVVVNSDSHVVKILEVYPHHSISLQLHRQRDEYWTRLAPFAGPVWFRIGNTEINPQYMNTYYVPRDTRHRIINESNQSAVILERIEGHYDENDIVRLQDEYGRA